MKTKYRTRTSSRPVPKGIRFGKILGPLAGLILAAFIAVPGFYWVNSMWNNDLREAEKEWGQSMQAVITDRGPLTAQYCGDYECLVRRVTVRPSGTNPVSVWMTEVDSNADTTEVWRSGQTGELYVSGDFDHFTNGVGYDTPIRIGDRMLPMVAIGFAAICVFFGFCVFGAVAAENYKSRDVRLRAQERRESY